MKAKIKNHIQWGAELPNNLIIYQGKIVDKETHEEITFEDFPDGTEVNVVPHDGLKKTCDEAMCWKMTGG